MIRKQIIVLLSMLLPTMAAWADDSGSCGENVTYTYVEATNTLTISGNGAMTDFPSYTQVIWRVKGYYDKIRTVIIEDGVTHIGEDAFSDCSSINSVTIPSSVTSIGSGAFQFCTSLSSITIPGSVTSIGRSAFSSSGLSHVTIPDGVTAIEERTFQYCVSLTSVDIPASVTYIGFLAFSGCTSLTSITIPDTVTDTGSEVFWNSGVKNPVYTNTLFVYLPTDHEGEYHIPEGIVKICGGAFLNCAGLSSVIIPEGVTSIDYRAFDNCTGLTSVTIPESVTEIGEYAFSGCAGLTSITIPENVTSVGTAAFYQCTNLASAFIYCQEIGTWCNIESLEEVTFGNKVTTIGFWAFNHCTKLTSLTIPASITSIDRLAFCDCSGVTSITVDENNPKYDSRDNCNAIIETETNTLIKGFACSFIPNGVKAIGDNAFYECNGLTSITIPASVTDIGIAAFDRCNDLITVVSEMWNPCSISNSSFSAILKAVGTLYVPAGTKSLYVAKNWNKYFANIEEMDEKPIWISIVDAERGTTKLRCKFGGIYTFCFEAADDWHIHSVTYKGEDVTAQLTSDGCFTTPPMSEDTELIVSYEKKSDAVGPMAKVTPFRVNAYQGKLTVSSTRAGTPIFVYDLSGRMLATATTIEGSVQLDNSFNCEVVTVRVGESCVKVRIK